MQHLPKIWQATSEQCFFPRQAVAELYDIGRDEVHVDNVTHDLQYSVHGGAWYRTCAEEHIQKEHCLLF